MKGLFFYILSLNYTSDCRSTTFAGLSKRWLRRTETDKQALRAKLRVLIPATLGVEVCAGDIMTEVSCNLAWPHMRANRKVRYYRRLWKRVIIDDLKFLFLQGMGITLKTK